MDPLSISAGVAQVVSLAGTLVKGLSRFVVKTINICDTIQEVHDEILVLQVALGNIQKTLKKRPRQLPFERDHHTHIYQIIQSCRKSLETLCGKLPQLKEKAGPFERIRRSLELSLKEERVVEIFRHIRSYKTVLQLSLTTLSLGALWETANSQKQIKVEIRKLTDTIRLFPHLFASHRRDVLPVRTLNPQSDLEDDTDENTLERDIKNWRRTADDVATAVTLNEIDKQSVDTNSIQNSSMSVDTLPLYQEDAFDPEPDYRNVQSSEILDYQLKANRDAVRNLLQCGIFVKAATYQQRGIELMKQLLETQDTYRTDDTSHEELMDMKEELADIFLQCDSVEFHLEAKTVLEQLISDVVKPEESQIDNNRRARLYHKLGDIHFRQGNVVQAKIFLTRALNGRNQIHPRPLVLVEETAELLVEVLQQEQVHDEARGIRDWIRQELRQETILTPLSPQTAPSDPNMNGLTSAYQWCKDQGMNVDSETFSFDYCDPASGMTPMHQAIQEENIEVLQHMVSNVAHVEQRDATGSTLLHAAAAKRNRHICAILLEERQANPDVVDHSGMTPLHKCQTRRRGVLVAEMLFQWLPDLIDRKDGMGKTALYMACEKGNEDMVKSLLSKGRANPDIKGPGNRTPLIVAIDLAAQQSQKIVIVEQLLKHGADPTIADADGRTAFIAAKHAGLAASEIKRMLSSIPPRKMSTTTMNSATSSGRRETSSNSSRIYSLAELALSR